MNERKRKNVYPVGLQIAHHLRRQDVCWSAHDTHSHSMTKIPPFRKNVCVLLRRRCCCRHHHRTSAKKYTHILINEFKQNNKRRSEIWLALYFHRIRSCNICLHHYLQLFFFLVDLFDRDCYYMAGEICIEIEIEIEKETERQTKEYTKKESHNVTTKCIRKL